MTPQPIDQTLSMSVSPIVHGACLGIRMQRPIVKVHILASVSLDEVVDGRGSSEENIIIEVEELLGEVGYSMEVKLDGIRIECGEI